MKATLTRFSSAWLSCLVLVFPSLLGVQAANQTLIPADAVWRYNATGVNLGTLWRDPDFIDSGWTSGPAQFGYGDGDEATVVSYGPDADNKYPCYYFRHTFSVANPSLFGSLMLRVLKDDGCVVYLNGHEVARYNMPSGEITYATYASGASEYGWETVVSLANTLVAGENVLAVEVHQGNATSSDLSFNLELQASEAIMITLDSPVGGAAEVSVPAELNATVTDPAGDSLTVEFYGRPAPSNSDEFSIAVLPDTQNYSQSYPGIFDAQTRWIVDSASALNTVFVCHEGDLVNTAGSIDQYWNASHSMNLLDGQVPYGVLPGNHDMPTTLYNQYFPYTKFQGQPWYGGHYPADKNDNSFQLFNAGGLDFIVIHMEFWPSSGTIQWANDVLATNQNRHAILVTHGYLGATGDRNVHVIGSTEYIWNDLIVPNPNLNLILCGHVHGEYTRTDALPGNRLVHQLLADYQSDTSGGNGWLRIMKFNPAYNQIQVKTYSPHLNLYKTDAASEFTLDYDMGGPEFALIQRNDGVASGAQTTATWTGLNFSSDYEWQVVATDGSNRQSSAVCRFTTTAGAPPNPPSGLAANPQSSASILLSWTDNSANESSFEIEQSLDGTAFSKTGSTAPDAVSALVTGLQPGTMYFYRVRAINGAGPSDYSDVAYATTLPPNNPPVANADAVDTAEDAAVAINLTGSDLDGDSLTFIVAAAPDHGTLSGTTSSLTYTPNANYFGVDGFTFRAFDGEDYSAPATVSITVSGVNDLPVAGSDTANTVQGVAVVINVLANDADVDGQQLTVGEVSQGTHGTVTINADGTVTYLPEAGFIGEDAFTYTASDGLSTGLGTVAVNVNPNILFSDGFESGNLTAGGWGVSGAVTVDASAALTGNFGALLKKTSVISKVLPGIGPGTVRLSYARRSVSLEAGESGSVEVSSDGQTWSSPIDTITGASAWEIKEFEVSLPSSDLHVRFRVNGNEKNDALMLDDVAVSGGTANNAPIAMPDDYSVNEDTILRVEVAGVLDNDTDADGGQLTVVLVSGPARGSVELNSDGSFSYTPEANFNGTDSFAYKASDGSAESSPATVTITVQAVNDAPVAGADTYTVEQDTGLSIAVPGVLANDTDVDGDALTVILETGPTNGTVGLSASGSFTYQPNTGYTGPDTFSYRLGDGNGGAATGSVNITVQPKASNAMHVGSILVSSQGAGKQGKRGYAEVIIVDANGNPVEGAVVAGTFSEDIQERLSSTTAADGKAVLLTTAAASGRCRLTFTVDDVSRVGLPYDPTANVESSDRNY